MKKGTAILMLYVLCITHTVPLTAMQEDQDSAFVPEDNLTLSTFTQALHTGWSKPRDFNQWLRKAEPKCKAADRQHALEKMQLITSTIEHLVPNNPDALLELTVGFIQHAVKMSPVHTEFKELFLKWLLTEHSRKISIAPTTLYALRPRVTDPLEREDAYIAFGTTHLKEYQQYQDALTFFMPCGAWRSTPANDALAWGPPTSIRTSNKRNPWPY